MTPLEKALILITGSCVLLLVTVALWPLFHQPPVPTVIPKSWQQQETDKLWEMQKLYQTPKTSDWRNDPEWKKLLSRIEPEVIQATPEWEQHQVQYRKLVEDIRSR